MSAESDARSRAEQFRHQLDLGSGPISDLVSLVEQALRIDIAVLPAAPDVHGLMVRDPERGVTMIAVAQTPNVMRQRSSLAHELGHVLFEDKPPASGNWADRSGSEIRADAFARHLLLPIGGLGTVVGERRSLELADLSNVTQRFVVSPALAAIQLHQAGLITSTRKASWMPYATQMLAAQFGWLDQLRALEAGANQQRAPQLLLARAIEGYRQGVVGAETIARLRSQPADQVVRDLASAGIAPAASGETVLADLSHLSTNDDFGDLDDDADRS